MLVVLVDYNQFFSISTCNSIYNANRMIERASERASERERSNNIQQQQQQKVLLLPLFFTSLFN